MLMLHVQHLLHDLLSESMYCFKNATAPARENKCMRKWQGFFSYKRHPTEPSLINRFFYNHEVIIGLSKELLHLMSLSVVLGPFSEDLNHSYV